ncbi:MAG TPA: carboxypeptidase-like regulatory domain-containing protein [Gemmatimonadaceae bacterium]
MNAAPATALRSAAWRAGVLVVVLSSAIAGLSRPGGAQVVRGRITEVASSNPVAGVLVSLLQSGTDSSVATVLSTAAGAYAIRAPATGRYRVAAKRIGVRRYMSAPFELRVGETFQLDVSLDAIALELPEVAVPGLCITRARDVPRVSSLWDEARTALQATEVSQRDRLFAADLSRHAAEVDPASMRVLFDWRSEARVLVEQPFISLSGDSLSRLGYWHRAQDDSLVFTAPDARALASNAFMRDHCFSLAGPVRGRPDLVGLRFQPARERRRPDITGTIWLDATTFELRYLSFRYTQLPPIPPAAHIGGEVHFALLATGAWIVERWFIRMPQFAVQPGLDPRWLLREEGGSVTADGQRPTASAARLSGIVRDSTGRGLPGAGVRAVGTSRQVTSDSAGAYRLDGLPPGPLSIVVHTDGYDAHALLVASRRVDLQPGDSSRFDVRAPAGRDIIADLCPRQLGQRPRSALRLIMVDSATAAPIPDVRFRFSMQRDYVPTNQPGERSTVWDRVTDSRGATTVCLTAAPAFPIDIAVVGADETPVPVMQVQLAGNELLTRIVSGRVNR